VPGPVAVTRPAPARPRPGLGSESVEAQVGPWVGSADPVRTGISRVDRLGRRLRALVPDHPQRYAVTDLSGRSAVEHGWIRAAHALPSMVAGAGDHLRVSPAVAGARMAGTLGYAAAGRLAVAIAVTGQAYDVGPQSLMVRLDDSGLVERIGVRNPVLVTAAADASVGPGPDPVTRLADLDAVIVWAADRAWATLAPLIEELHEVTRYGRVPMWNLVADSVLGPATIAPWLAGRDQRAGRAAGSAFLDALVARGAPIHRRGTLRRSTLDGLTPVRGSCCLHFRQTQEKCASCPLERAT
jgi:hypothetical protein